MTDYKDPRDYGWGGPIRVSLCSLATSTLRKLSPLRKMKKASTDMRKERGEHVKVLRKMSADALSLRPEPSYVGRCRHCEDLWIG